MKGLVYLKKNTILILLSETIMMMIDKDDYKKTTYSQYENLFIFYFQYDNICFIITENDDTEEHFYLKMKIEPKTFKLIAKKKNDDLADKIEYEGQFMMSSTRGSLETTDLIPPSKQQIIAVLVFNIDYDTLYKNLNISPTDYEIDFEYRALCVKLQKIHFHDRELIELKREIIKSSGILLSFQNYQLNSETLNNSELTSL